MSVEQHVKHLWDCALSLDGETHTKKLIKSYLINVCRKVAGAKDSIPLERFAESQMCRHCSLHWHENESKMKLKPQAIDIKTNKAKRLIAKLKAQQNGKEIVRLSKKQKKRAKWLLKHSEPKVEIKCQFCQHKTLVALKKPSQMKTEKKSSDPNDIVIPESTTLSHNTKKKKKTKDPHAGLKIPKPLKLETSKEVSRSKKHSIENATTITPIDSKKINAKAIKQKPKNPEKKKAQQTQSKTQKQNSLLQLAALLKTQDQNKAQGSANPKSRLESLLE